MRRPPGLLELGIAPGQKVAILANTRPEWVETDLAIYGCGGVSVPIYQSNLPHECGYILANSESRVCFVENPKQLAKIRSAQRDGFELDGQRTPVEVYAPHPDRRRARRRRRRDPRRSPRARPRRARARRPRDRRARRRRRPRRPRDHRLHLGHDRPAEGRHADARQPSRGARGRRRGRPRAARARSSSSSSRSRIRSRGWSSTTASGSGTITAFATSIDVLAQEIAETRPHLIPSVPRIYEKIYARIMSTRESGSTIKRWLFDWALDVGRARSLCQQRGQAMPLHLAVQARGRRSAGVLAHPRRARRPGARSWSRAARRSRARSWSSSTRPGS